MQAATAAHAIPATCLTRAVGMWDSYRTRDLFTNPPTVIYIVFNENAQLMLPLQGQTTADSPLYVLPYTEIEPTAGWLSDRNNASLDICFMHSFGKCFGKVRDKNPRSCHQIHIKRESLDLLRKQYVNPQRSYFCRTIKANVDEKVMLTLSHLAQRRICFQYLEFKVEDVEATVGSMEYEMRYRHWLTSETDGAASGRVTLHARRVCTGVGLTSAPVVNYISTSYLCYDYAIHGYCTRETGCHKIHGHVLRALTKDRHVNAVVEHLCAKARLASCCGEVSGVGPSLPNCAYPAPQIALPQQQPHIAPTTGPHPTLITPLYENLQPASAGTTVQYNPALTSKVSLAQQPFLTDLCGTPVLFIDAVPSMNAQWTALKR